jgi:hypothetical protein
MADHPALRALVLLLKILALLKTGAMKVMAGRVVVVVAEIRVVAAVSERQVAIRGLVKDHRAAHAEEERLLLMLLRTNFRPYSLSIAEIASSHALT